MWITPFSGPSQRSWLSRDEPAPEAGHVGEHAVEVEPDHERCEGVDGGDLDLRAAPHREGEAVALETVPGVRLDHDVRGGVVRVRVHRVGPVERAGRRKADVGGLEGGDGGQGRSFVARGRMRRLRTAAERALPCVCAGSARRANATAAGNRALSAEGRAG